MIFNILVYTIAIFVVLFGSVNIRSYAYTNGNQIKQEQLNPSAVQSVVLSWPEISGAVAYEVEVVDKNGHRLYQQAPIFASGVELTATQMPNKEFQDGDTWSVRGLNEDLTPLNAFATPRLILEGQYFRPQWAIWPEDLIPQPYNQDNYIVDKDLLITPLKLTSQYQLMRETPMIYPTYSWVPISQATHYQIDIYNTDAGYRQFWRSIKIDHPTSTKYDDEPFHKPGKYYFEIIAFDKNNHKIAQSVAEEIIIPPQANIVALGDSITHGGGAISTAPSSTLYNWEYYAHIPMINLGYSGNTTTSMLKRFEQDVLVFNPRIVLIMGGINDLRLGTPATTVIANLEAMKNLALQHHIIPIFLTVTSLNPGLMGAHNLRPADFWIENWRQVNAWIKEQEYVIDVNTSPEMLDQHQFLPSKMTTDGLHPDARGKQLIGEAVAQYLRRYFPEYIQIQNTSDNF